MSAIVLESAREALALDVKNLDLGKPSGQTEKGLLQGRKVVPGSFYLHVAGGVLGGVAAVALAIVAIAMSVFLLHVAVAACVLLCATNLVSAYSLYRLTPEKEVDSIIGKLSTRIHDLININRDLRKNAETKKTTSLVTEPSQDVKNEISVCCQTDKKDVKHTNTDQVQDEKISSNKEESLDTTEEHGEGENSIKNKPQQKPSYLEKTIHDQAELLEKFRNDITSYAKKQEEDKQKLKESLDKIIEVFEVNEEDKAALKAIDDQLEDIDFDEKIENPQELFEKLLKNSQCLYNQFSRTLPIMENYLRDYDNDYESLVEENKQQEEKFQSLRTSKDQIEANLNKSIADIKRLTDEMAPLKALQSQLTDSTL